MRVARLVLIAVVAVASACGDAADSSAGDATADDSGVPADGATPRSLTELLDDPVAGDVVVEAVLLDEGTGVRMCEALAESFPPQCGGRSLAVTPDDSLVDVTWTEHDGIRWTDRPVELRGRVVDETFVVS